MGYALATDRSLLAQHPLLNDLGTQINKIPFGVKFIGDFDYLVVGQLCVAKEVRGRGLAQDIYAQFKATYENQYHYPKNRNGKISLFQNLKGHWR